MIGCSSNTFSLTDGGRNFCTGSSSATSPFATISASRMPVNPLVIDPISNTVSPSGVRESSRDMRP